MRAISRDWQEIVGYAHCPQYRRFFAPLDVLSPRSSVWFPPFLSASRLCPTKARTRAESSVNFLLPRDSVPVSAALLIDNRVWRRWTGRV